MTLCYLAGQIDRSNAAFAAKAAELLRYDEHPHLLFMQGGMLDDLGMDKEEYGFGAGLFFVGYVCMQLPGNLILRAPLRRRNRRRALLEVMPVDTHYSSWDFPPLCN